jgi:putative membrane protein
MKKLFLLSACAATMWLVQACSSTSETTAGDTTTTDTSNTASIQLADSVFIAKAAAGGMAEVELGNLALAKTTNSSIKDFANMMVTDHTKANEELMAMAKNKSFTLADSLDGEHKAKADNLRNLSGTAFDKAYMATMVEDHQKTLELMRTEASTGVDANLKDFAAKTAPVVQTHLEHAQKLQSSLK